jgi:NTP pyrophosphatase (non-canonical NTP hydrolase)
MGRKMKPKKFIERSVNNDMPNKDYTPILMRLNKDRPLLRRLHAAIGISGEAGEILDYFKKGMMFGKIIDRNKVKEECGDLLWYMSIMLDSYGFSFEEIMQANYDKLRVRYPNGFSEKDALLRRDELELVSNKGGVDFIGCYESTKK